MCRHGRERLRLLPPGFGLCLLSGLVLAVGCGGGGDKSGRASSRTTTTQVTTATPNTPEEAAALVRSASDRLGRVRDVAQARRCERKAGVEQVRDKTRADARALARFARQDGRPQVRRLMRVSIDALEKGGLAANSFLATCP